ncbi:hypothetical protein ACQZV8_20430 [Magnetococcales bacterium HHB-1]
MKKSQNNSKKRTCWHCFIGDMLKTLLQPVGIEVRSEVQIVESPKADLVLIRRKGKQWTKQQRVLLADGLRDLNADHILAELKITESLNEAALQQTLAYDRMFRTTEELPRERLQSVLISAKTPKGDILQKFGFEPLEQAGVYACRNSPWCSTMRVILLNELTNEFHNAPLKCFSSRHVERIGVWTKFNKGRLLHIKDTAGWIASTLLTSVRFKVPTKKPKEATHAGFNRGSIQGFP